MRHLTVCLGLYQDRDVLILRLAVKTLKLLGALQKNKSQQSGTILKHLEFYMISASNSYVGDREFPSGDLQQIWKAVVSRLGSVSKALFHAHGTLCFLNDRGALVSIKTEPLLKLALGKRLELETAFRKVCGRPIPVNLTIAPSSPMQLVKLLSI